MPKKKDFILIGVLLVIALIGLGVTQFLQHQTGASVTITIGGGDLRHLSPGSVPYH